MSHGVLAVKYGLERQAVAVDGTDGRNIERGLGVVSERRGG